MWPDDEEEPARIKLRMSLYDLARVLPPDLEGTSTHRRSAMEATPRYRVQTVSIIS
jgi:hypothetical protein